MSDESFKKARILAVTLLGMEPNRNDRKVIERCVAQATLAVETPGMEPVDQPMLVAQLMHEANIYVPDSSMMDDPTDHIEWLPARRGKVEWKFWKRYEQFVETEKGFPSTVVRALDLLTDEIVAKIENPERPAPWDCRGMVVGSVQSGKTANYCGVICKAIDAGYKLIVVLAGMHNNLRSQTQYRLDEGVLGRDSQKERNLDQQSSLIGVGKLFGQTLPIHTLTSSLENGDFSAPRADTGVTIGGDPVILVIKKNGSVLRNLLKWVLHVRGEELDNGPRKIVRNVPLLVVDDEADNASINTRERVNQTTRESDVTAINGRIRELLDAFDKSAYIGYTATPFANIFIDPEAETEQHGQDLFPRNFILNVSPPSSYVSPARVFGIDGDEDAGIEPHEPLPLIRIVEDHEDIFPARHKKNLSVHELPQSLIEAIHAFVLVCAIRRARGQADVHNSMLVHVTRFVDVQNRVATLVRDRVDTIRRKLQIGEGAREDTLLSSLKELWRRDFEGTTQSYLGVVEEEQIQNLSWNEIANELPMAASRIEVREINGYAKEGLDYVAHRQGLSVISVGGDKLSRGLTLEGLSVSYFLRTTRMYDTLMQMGRWFGYRPGYLDLCRLYSTDELVRWYRHIALAEIELRREFDRMRLAGMTPAQYGLRVRESPGGLLITAMNKMRHATTQRLSYAGQLVQTSSFSTDKKIVRANRDTVASFVKTLGNPEKQGGGSPNYVWLDISQSHLIEGLLQPLHVAAESWRFQKTELIDFIRNQSERGELVNWTVVLVNTTGGKETVSLGGTRVSMAIRKPEDNSWEPATSCPPLFTARSSNIQSPNHHAIDLDYLMLDSANFEQLREKRSLESGARLFQGDELSIIERYHKSGGSIANAANEISGLARRSAGGTKGSTQVNGLLARQLRPKTHGLLLVYPIMPRDRREWDKNLPFMGLVIGFPTSDTARAVTYKVTKTFRESIRDDDYDDED